MKFNIENVKEKIFRFLIGIFLEIFSIIDDLATAMLFFFAAFIFACAVKIYFLEIENKSQIIIIFIVFCFLLIYFAGKVRSQNAH